MRSTVGNVTVAGNAFFACEWWAQGPCSGAHFGDWPPLALLSTSD
jgi:hypothetical protein